MKVYTVRGLNSVNAEKNGVRTLTICKERYEKMEMSAILSIFAITFRYQWNGRRRES